MHMRLPLSFLQNEKDQTGADKYVKYIQINPTYVADYKNSCKIAAHIKNKTEIPSRSRDPRGKYATPFLPRFMIMTFYYENRAGGSLRAIHLQVHTPAHTIYYLSSTICIHMLMYVYQVKLSMQPVVSICLVVTLLTHL